VSRFALFLALMLVSSSMPVQTQQRSETYPSYPSQAQGEQTEPAGQTVILPPSYLGCWRGLVAASDTLQTLNGCEAGPFVPELYTLCYRNTPAGKFELTFRGVAMDTAVPDQYKISGTGGEVQVLASDGVGKVKLHSYIHFEQNEVGTAAASDATWSMDEQTEMDCEMKDGDLQVLGAYTQISDGMACFRGTWHTRFLRADD
jgi:hypothetical protein